ncbi:MAG: YIP1 family protein [Acidiferrobacter sp.]
MRAGDTTTGVLRVIRDTVIAVTLRPVAFFQAMPKQGGFRAPFVFLLVVGLFDMLLLSLFQGFMVGPAAGVEFAVHALALAPLALTFSGFVLTTVLFVFWRLMGSTQSYETAYRTFVYSYAVSPVTTVMGFTPYLAFVGFFWWFGLLVIGSIYVHGIHRIKAIAVFAVLGVAMLVFLTRVEHYAMRHGLAQAISQPGHLAPKPASDSVRI